MLAANRKSAFLVWLALSAALALATAEVHASAKWIEYIDCQLTPGAYFDGDSFNNVVSLRQGATRPSRMNWRLYGVDCPETDERHPDRLHEQAKAFGIPDSKVIYWGERGKEFAEKFLAQPFRVMTLREEARGASKRKRYFAIVIGADGRLLHEALLEAGLARAFGMPAPWPPGNSDRKKFQARLEELERRARSNKVGMWADSTGLPTRTTTPTNAKPAPQSAEDFLPELMQFGD